MIPLGPAERGSDAACERDERDDINGGQQWSKLVNGIRKSTFCKIYRIYESYKINRSAHRAPGKRPGQLNRPAAASSCAGTGRIAHSGSNSPFPALTTTLAARACADTPVAELSSVKMPEM